MVLPVDANVCREEDVSEAIYKDTMIPKLPSNPRMTNGKASIVHAHAADSKVNKICQAFLNVLQHHKATNLQNIISAHVCKSPPDLQAGLLQVAELQSTPTSLQGKLIKSENHADDPERAIEHICFLADVNKLYDTALGMYDLDLVLLVAQQSQKVWPQCTEDQSHHYRILENICHSFKISKSFHYHEGSLPLMIISGDMRRLSATYEIRLHPNNFSHTW